MQQVSKFLRGTKIKAEIWDFSEISLKLMINSKIKSMTNYMKILIFCSLAIGCNLIIILLDYHEY